MRVLREWGLPILAWAVGMVVAHSPMIFSALRQMQWDLGDTRLLVYVLEHSFRWVMRSPHHLDFWSPPFFYPARNVAAYSENLLGVAPFYWSWRWLGAPMDSAFQLWILSVSTLNFAAAYALLRRALVHRPESAAIGAFVFAFGASRINQLGHEQLLPQFYTIIAIYSLIRLVSKPDLLSAPRALLYIAAFFLAIVAQLYASVYYGWFLVLALGVAAPFSLLSAVRSNFWNLIKRHWLSIGIAAALSAWLLSPMIIHYLRSAGQVGYRPFSEVNYYQARWASWLDIGPYSWLYGRLADLSIFKNLPAEHEQRLSFGYFTTFLSCVGLVIGRRKPIVQVLLALSLILGIASTSTAAGATAWRFVYHLVPGAAAIRTMARIGVLALIPGAIGVALCVEHFFERGIWYVVPIFSLACVAEQRLATPFFDKLWNRSATERIAAQIDPKCEAFFYAALGGRFETWKYHLDAMWASLISRVPTLNGYTGNSPPGWVLFESNIRDAPGVQRVRFLVHDWVVRNHLAPEHVCLLFLPADERWSAEPAPH